ncbi:MAG: alpha/beta hydrolase [Oceanospirillaceae bacterium]|nr:alpha/beta hydrolase [Oceanospirillaceae bacterium]
MNKLIQLAVVAPLLALMSTLVSAQEITIKDHDLRLNAKLNIASESITDGPLVLLVHGTLAHNSMEIMANLQTLLEDESVNSLAINLSLGMDDRHGMYDCAVPHQHRHEDAMGEIALWIQWLKDQGVDKVLIAGHSRGGSQVAAYNQNPDAIVLGQVLVAPATWNAKAMAESYHRRYQKHLTDLIKVAQQQTINGWMPQATDFIYCNQAPKVKAASFLSYYNPPQTLNTPDLLIEGGLHTVVLAGSEDQVVRDLPAQLEVRELSNVEFILVDGADHYFRDLYSDDIVEAILDSIDTLVEGE